MKGQKQFVPYTRAKIDMFLPILSVILSSKQAECLKYWALRAELKGAAGHIDCARRTTADQEVLALIAPLGKLIVIH